MNGTRPCPYCKSIFTLVENQGNMHWEVNIKELENQIIHYQQHNKNLQFQVGLEQMQKKKKRETKTKSRGKITRKRQRHFLLKKT